MEILISIFISIALMELYAWLDPLAKWLVDQVAKKLPEDRQADFTEQFMADLATLPNSVAKVYFAFRDCTLSAQNIYQGVYREKFLSMADDFDALFNKMSLFDQSIEVSTAQARSNFQSSSAFISAVDQSLETLRRSQRQDDPDAETAIHHFQALSSPAVGILSTIQAGFEQRHARFDGLMDRLRERLARAIEAKENVRRRMLDDDKPLDDNDIELVSSFNERVNDIGAIRDQYNAEAGSPDDLPDIPAFPASFVTQVEAIVEALQAAVRVVKRPR
jgi:hypothetical protein